MAVQNAPTTLTTHDAAVAQLSFGERIQEDPAYAAFWLLRIGFIALPGLMGIDKFFNLLADWPSYLAPWVVDLLPFSAETAMYLAGIVEIAAAVLVAIKPRYSSYVVALWLAGIMLNLLTYSGFYDVALRDFGLFVAALTLALLARKYDAPFGAANTNAAPADTSHVGAAR